MEPNAIKPTDEFFNEVGMQYEEAYAQNTGLEKILPKFINMLPKDARILDCGCGTGRPVSSTIAESGCQVYSINLSSVMVDLCRKQVPKGVFEAVNMLHYTPPVSFGGVVASSSFFQLTHDKIISMIHKLSQWLQPGGLLLMSVWAAKDCVKITPDMYEPDGQYAIGIPTIFMGHQNLMTLFTKAGWNGLLEKAGFGIIHTETDFCRPSVAAGAVSDEGLDYFIIARKPISA